MTSYLRKVPVVTALLFFGVAALFSILNGAGIQLTLVRGAIAGGISYVFSALFTYILFVEDIPQPKIPSDIRELRGKFDDT